jgi:flagellar biosynthesis protein FliR
MVHKIGTAIQVLGLIVLVYAVAVFFFLQDLPPNSATSRLPSLYLMFEAIVGLLLGSVVKTISKAVPPQDTP